MPGSDQPGPDIGGAGARRLLALIRRKPLTARRAAVIIAIFTTAVTAIGGTVASLADRKDFDSVGEGLWWALQTVTTVGYGDVVPSSGAGRAIAAIVMISGIAFLTVVTAAVTATFIEAARRRGPHAADRDLPPELVEEVRARLAAIESRLDELGPRPGD